MTNSIKTLFLVISLTYSFLGQAQTDTNWTLAIDTVRTSYHIPNVIRFSSEEPHLKRRSNPIAIESINSDLQNQYSFGDTINYIEQMLLDFPGQSLGGLIQDRIDYNMYADQMENTFSVEYISPHLISFVIQHHNTPYHSRDIIEFKTVTYDLRTGNKMKLEDLFTLKDSTLQELFISHGETLVYEEDTVRYQPILNDEYLTGKLQDIANNLFSPQKEGGSCSCFYLKNLNGKLYLMVKAMCIDPNPLYTELRLCLDKLTQYFEFFDFKNIYKQWGRTAKDLIGQKGGSSLGDSIHLSNYSLTGGGGHLINYNFTDSTYYGISYYHSPEAFVYLMERYIRGNGTAAAVITDVLEIPRAEVINKQVIFEFCESDKPDPELVAIVSDKGKPEYYTRIVKAWKANRRTEKFEPFSAKSVRRCGNEGFGD